MARRNPYIEFIQFIVILFVVFCGVRVFALYADMGIIKLPVDPFLWPIVNFIKAIDFDYYLQGTMDFLDKIFALYIY